MDYIQQWVLNQCNPGPEPAGALYGFIHDGLANNWVSFSASVPFIVHFGTIAMRLFKYHMSISILSYSAFEDILTLWKLWKVLNIFFWMPMINELLCLAGLPLWALWQITWGRLGLQLPLSTERSNENLIFPPRSFMAIYLQVWENVFFYHFLQLHWSCLG